MSEINIALHDMKDAFHAIIIRSQQAISQVQLQNDVSSLKNDLNNFKNNMSDLRQEILS